MQSVIALLQFNACRVFGWQGVKLIFDGAGNHGGLLVGWLLIEDSRSGGVSFLSLAVKVGLNFFGGFLTNDTSTNSSSSGFERISLFELFLNHGIILGFAAGFVGISDSIRRGHASTEETTGDRCLQRILDDLRHRLARVNRDLVDDTIDKLVKTFFRGFRKGFFAQRLGEESKHASLGRFCCFAHLWGCQLFSTSSTKSGGDGSCHKARNDSSGAGSITGATAGLLHYFGCALSFGDAG